MIGQPASQSVSQSVKEETK